MFGFIKKFFTQEEEIIKLNLTELAGKIAEKKSVKETELKKTIFQKFSEIKYLLNELNKIREEIEKIDLITTEGSQKLRKIVQTNKDHFSMHLKALIKKLNPPTTENLEIVQEYCINSNGIISNELASFWKNIVITNALIKKEVKEVGNKIKELNDCTYELKQIFENSEIFKTKKVELNILNLKQKIEEKKEKEKQIIELETCINYLQKQEEKKRKEMEEKNSNPEAIELKQLEEKTTKTIQKETEIKQKLVDILAPINKILTKLQKLIKSKKYFLKPEEEKILEFYLNNSENAIKSDLKGDLLKNILKETKKAIELKSINLNDVEKEKKLKEIEKIEKYDFFTEIFWKLNEVEVEKKVIEKRIENISIQKEINLLNEELKEIENELKEKENNLTENKKRIEKMGDEIIVTKKTIEEKSIEFLNKKIELKSEL